MFKLSDLDASIGLDIPHRALQHVKGAYLCLHAIPTTAITEVALAREVEDGV